MGKKIKKINITDQIILSDSVTMTLESNHLLQSNKDNLQNLLINSELDRNNLIDIFISLHIVLEVGINTLFRKLITPTLRKNVNLHVMIENLDNINFIDKTIMFIYYSKFNFDDVSKATEYHKIINKIRAFSEIRNKLLHGHVISSISKDGKNSESTLIKKLNLSQLQTQIKDFRFILDGMCFYLDALDSNLTQEGKDSYKKAYLDHNFLPHVSFDSKR